MINGQMDAHSCSMHVMSFAMSCHVTGWNTMQNKAGQRTQKQDGTQHTFFKKTCGVGTCALHEIGVRSLLKHRTH